jgi:hypothetical protein
MDEQEEKIEKFLKKDRWYVRISSNGSSKTMPQANYIWLKGNPAFLDIPKDYLIHHLDEDRQNDDISNLAIMQKYHHIAYHWKHKIVKPELDLAEGFIRVGRTRYAPIREPRIYRLGDGFRVYLREKTFEGETKGIFINRWEGKPIKTREMAEWVKSQIWLAQK